MPLQALRQEISKLYTSVSMEDVTVLAPEEVISFIRSFDHH
jgi:hypothetical protein